MKIGNTWLAVTYQCNNKCGMCYSQDAEKETMSLDFALGSVRFLSEIGAKNMILIGGEPTSHPNLPAIISEAKSYGLSRGMVTNGRRIAKMEYLDSLLNEGLNGLTISVHGSSPEVHDKVTNIDGSFYETIQGIRNVVQRKGYANSSTTISASNVEDLENIIEVLSKEGVRRIGFNACTTAPDMESTDTLRPSEVVGHIQRLYKFGKTKGVRVKSITPLPICNFDEDVRDEMLAKGLLNYSCQMFRGSGLAIAPNGDILPCVHWNLYPIGNIVVEGKIMDKQQFEDFWTDKNQLPSQFRQALWRYPSKACNEDGKYWGECIGGCPSFWTEFEPKKEIRGMVSTYENILVR